MASLKRLLLICVNIYVMGPHLCVHEGGDGLVVSVFSSPLVQYQNENQVLGVLVLLFVSDCITLLYHLHVVPETKANVIRILYSVPHKQFIYSSAGTVKCILEI